MRGLGKGFPQVNEFCTDRFSGREQDYFSTTPAEAGAQLARLG
jgi:hypothetical protein